MSSSRNHSVKVLLGELLGQVMYYHLLHERFREQQTRLIQRPDQTGALTVEQQNVNQSLSAVLDAFVAGTALGIFYRGSPDFTCFVIEYLL